MVIEDKICKICLKSTQRVDIDYLIDTNHLSCEILNSEISFSSFPNSN